MVNNWLNFTQNCLQCGILGQGILCKDCQETLPYNPICCDQCALPLPNSSPAKTICGECLKKPPHFDHVFAPLLYKPPISDWLNLFKHQLSLPEGRLLAELMLKTQPENIFDAVIPVPLTPEKYRLRGFNQSQELAKVICHKTKWPLIDNLLWRKPQDKQQQGANRRQRIRQLRGVFFTDQASPKKVLLIDDVVTTGATVNEAAKTLKKAGANTVHVWAIARTPAPGN